MNFEKRSALSARRDSRPPRCKLLIWPHNDNILSAEIARDGRGGRRDTTIRLFQRGGDDEFLRRRIVLYAQYVGPAANLAVFDVALPASRGFVNVGGVPFSTTRALKTGFHKRIIFRRQSRRNSIRFNGINRMVIAHRMVHFRLRADLGAFSRRDRGKTSSAP